MTYDEAVAQLFQAPHAEFVAVRKRLAGELKAGGDKDGAAKLGKLGRPPTSAWAVNQLYWKERDSFDALMESAEKLRKGAKDAQAEYREATATLRVKAAKVLEADGHGATEATLRKVAATLSAIAVAGFGDEMPGALQEDRDPPGFDAMVGVVVKASEENDQQQATGNRQQATGNASETGDRGTRNKAETEKKKEEEFEKRKKEEQERARRAAHRSKLEAALSTARIEAAVRARNVEALKAQLDEAETRVAKADAQVAEIEAELEALDATAG